MDTAGRRQRISSNEDDSSVIAVTTSVLSVNDVESSPSLIGYRFLLDSGISTAALVDALEVSRDWGVTLPEALTRRGFVTPDAYCAAVADVLGVRYLTQCEVTATPPIQHVGRHGLYRLRGDGRPVYVLPATAGSIDQLEATKRDFAMAGADVVVATPRIVDEAVERANRSEALRAATLSLRETQPALSASTAPPVGQAVVLSTIIGLFLGGFVVAPGHAVAALLALLTLSFIGVVLVRIVAAVAILSPRRGPDRQPVASAHLPRYTIMVPLFDEGAVVLDLIASLSALDYPAGKLEIMLVLEEADLATKIALLHPRLPSTFRTIVVPDALPRTKPKAINYAMRFAHGDFIVVFDAEDRPEPDQLRKAVAAFRDGPVNLACVQARLNIYNPTETWFTRQFTIEYSALFDAILPALDRLRLPLPLGGTSNHFPRALLQAIGGWDPFNVTEDADLGIRLARLGYVTQVLDSTTWEEAPVTWQQWKPQRTRWLKGWYQTYLVHTRQPWRVLRDLGLWQWFGFHLFLGGVILSTLVHPWFYVLVIWTIAASGTPYAVPSLVSDGLLPLISMATLALGYGTAILVGAVAAHRRGHGLIRSALAMPLSWLLISFAAYRALWQLWRDPFKWEKTAHGRSSMTRVPEARAPATVPQPRASPRDRRRTST